MSLSISDAASEGLRNTFSKKGLVLTALTSIAMTVYLTGYISLSMVNSGSFQSMLQSMQYGFLASIGSPAVAGTLTFIGLLSLAYLAMVTARTMQHDVDFVPLNFFEQNMPLGYIHFLAAGTLFLLAYMFGLILLILPGLYLWGALVYFVFFVAVEDQTALQALKSSWNLSRDNRLKTVLLFIVYTIMSGVLQIIAYFIAIMLFMTAPSVGIITFVILMIIASSLSAVFLMAMHAEAYNQLKTE